MSASPQPRRTSGRLGPEGLIFADILEPAAGDKRRTHVMIHGAMHSGACWIETPDGRPGWGVMLAEAGDKVICPDWPGTGRSGHVPPDELTSQVIVDGIVRAIEPLGGDLVLWTHSTSGPFGWKIAERLGPRLTALVAVAPGQPGNIQPVAPVLEDTEEALTVSLFGRPWRLPKTGLFPPSRDLVWFKFVDGVTHFPVDSFDRYHGGLQGIPVKVLAERLNVDGTQLTVDDPTRLASTRVVVVTGDHDPDHPRAADEEIVTFFAVAGIDARFLYLPDHGISGNGHMMMLETNNREVLQAIRAIAL